MLKTCIPVIMNTNCKQSPATHPPLPKQADKTAGSSLLFTANNETFYCNSKISKSSIGESGERE